MRAKSRATESHRLKKPRLARAGLDRLRLRNFRSFRSLDASFGAINLIIGPNASGKSNLLAAIQFLRDIAEDGLSDAVSLQGGPSLIPHVNYSREPVEIEVGFTRSGIAEGIADLFLVDAENVEFSDQKTSYRIVLDVASESDPRILDESLRVDFRCSWAHPQTSNKATKDSNVNITLDRNDDGLSVHFKLPEHLNPRPSPVLDYLTKTWRPVFETALLDQRNSLLQFRPGSDFQDIPIFDLNPELARDAVFFTGKNELDDDGENLPIVLRRILDDPEKARKYKLLLSHLLPYASDIETETYSDLTTTIEVRDRLLNRILPSSALSTGTIFATALVAAIHFEDSSVICLEEPDRYLHAGILPKLAELIKSRSNERQIIVTTHNSSFIRNFNAEEANFLCLYRTANGESKATTPQHSDKILQFLTSHVDLATLNEDALLTD